MAEAAKKSVIPRLSPRWVAIGEYLLMLLVVFYSAVWCLYTSANCNTALRFGVPLLAVLILCGTGPVSPRLWRRVGVLAVFLAVYVLATRYNAVRYLLYYFTPLLLLTLYMGGRSDGGVRLLHRLSDIPYHS